MQRKGGRSGQVVQATLMRSFNVTHVNFPTAAFYDVPLTATNFVFSSFTKNKTKNK